VLVAPIDAALMTPFTKRMSLPKRTVSYALPPFYPVNAAGKRRSCAGCG